MNAMSVQYAAGASAANRALDSDTFTARDRLTFWRAVEAMHAMAERWDLVEYAKGAADAYMEFLDDKGRPGG